MHPGVVKETIRYHSEMPALATMTNSTEAAIRLGCFAGVLVGMLIWELVAPRRQLTVSRPWRWTSNLSLVVMNTLVARLIVPITAVAAATAVESRGWGVLSLVEWPHWLEITLAVLLLDLAIYLQHVLFHAVPLFWRLHKVHHADLDFDVTTGVRFHTLEILLSALIKLAAIAVLGPTAIAVIIFEILLNATSMFNHSNVAMPLWIDRVLRWLVVTPDMHRVHHSIIRSETDSNYGFNFPWWDRLLGTYRPQPEAGHIDMTIGIPTFRDEHDTERLPAMLWMPFTSHRRDPDAAISGDKHDRST